MLASADRRQHRPTGNIVFRDFVGVDFPCAFIVGFLHTRHSAGLEHATLFDQFIDAFGAAWATRESFLV